MIPQIGDIWRFRNTFITRYCLILDVNRTISPHNPRIDTCDLFVLELDTARRNRYVYDTHYDRYWTREA